MPGVSSDVAIATITWARSDSEEAALREALTTLCERGWPVVIADRSGRAAFRAFLDALPNTHLVEPTEPGLVPQVQASVARAASLECRAIAYVEPDKTGFFRSGLEQMVADGVAQAGGVLLAARSTDAFRSFPSMQQYAEGVINRLVGERIGAHGDYSYGPFVMERALADIVSRAPRHLGWGWRHFLFVSAHRDGRPVGHRQGDFACPRDQQHETAADRVHRLRQLSENLLGLVEAERGG